MSATLYIVTVSPRFNSQTTVFYAFMSVCVFPDLDRWAVCFVHKHTFPECIAEHLSLQSVRVCVRVVLQCCEFSMIKKYSYLTVVCLCQVHEVKASSEPGREDSSEEVSTTLANHFLNCSSLLLSFPLLCLSFTFSLGSFIVTLIFFMFTITS